jgi:Protein of unknown function (DUF2911).
MKRISILLAVLALGASLRADLNLPDASQLAVTKQRIGLTDIKVTYHRPLVNGRKIWGGWFRSAKSGAPVRMKIRLSR